jgi:hypothetical protein
MRIYEIIILNNDPTGNYRSAPQPDLPPNRFNDDLINLANAFTRDGLVKHFWNFQGSGDQTSEPAQPAAGTQLIPGGTLEPTTASWQAEPVESEPPVVQNRLVPFRQ